MSNYDFVGIDISKAKFDAYILKADKKLHKVFPNQANGFQRFFQWLNQNTQLPWVIMEATGHYSEPLADFLFQQACRVSVVNPLQIKHFAKAKLARHKTDKADALVIAHYGSAMSPSLYQPRSDEQKAIREQVQLIDPLKEQTQQLKNQADSIQNHSVKAALQQTIDYLAKQIQLLTATLEHHIQASERYRHWVALLTSIKGIGKTSAFQLIAYLPNMALFKQAKQLAAFIGVSPKQKESGKYVGKTCLSKFGNPRLRKALYMPALSLKKNNEHLQPFIVRLEHNGLQPKAIVGALMRKLVHIIFGILKSNLPFNPKFV